MLPWSVVDLLIQRHALRKQQHHHRVEQRLHRVRVAPLILASISAVLPYSFFSPTNHQSALVEQQLHHLRVALAACYSPASARCSRTRPSLRPARHRQAAAAPAPCRRPGLLLEVGSSCARGDERGVPIGYCRPSALGAETFRTLLLVARDGEEQDRQCVLFYRPCRCGSPRIYPSPSHRDTSSHKIISQSPTL